MTLPVRVTAIAEVVEAPDEERCVTLRIVGGSKVVDAFLDEALGEPFRVRFDWPAERRTPPAATDVSPPIRDLLLSEWAR